MATTAIGDEGGYGEGLSTDDIEVKTAKPDAKKAGRPKKDNKEG